MSPESWVTVVLIGLLAALLLGTLNEALSKRSRERVEAVYRFFVKPRTEIKEVSDEPSR